MIKSILVLSMLFSCFSLDAGYSVLVFECSLSDLEQIRLVYRGFDITETSVTIFKTMPDEKCYVEVQVNDEKLMRFKRLLRVFRIDDFSQNG
jgi:hypothetical protein